MVPNKTQYQSPQHVGLLDADLSAGLLESQMLTQREPGLLLDVERFCRHGWIHLAALIGSFSLHKKPAQEHVIAGPYSWIPRRAELSPWHIWPERIRHNLSLARQFKADA